VINPLQIPLAQRSSWYQYWLPANYAEHGDSVDLLFIVIFIVTVGIGLAVLLLLLKYCIQYRHREGRRGHFSHGNKRLELIWTIIPAILLLGLALWTKASWDRFRYASEQEQASAARILVIAEQFNWNTIYPGPDNKFGRYLVFPKTTDPKWPAMPPGQESYLSEMYDGMSGGKSLPPGPAYLPQDDAKKLIDAYVSINKLGKDFADPAGKDDDWQSALARPVYVPKGRLVEVTLTSKDVIHDFFLPHFRVKLDAVPGMRGTLYFTPTQTSADYEKEAMAGKRSYDLQEARKLVGYGVNLRLIVPEDPAEKAKYSWTEKSTRTRTVRGKRVTEEVESTVDLATGTRLDNSLLDTLETRLGLKAVEAYTIQEWEVVCEELCGNSHTRMQGRVIVLTPEAYGEQFEGKQPGPSPAATQPVAAQSAAAEGVVAVSPPAR